MPLKKKKEKNRLSHNISRESEDRTTPTMIRYIEGPLSSSPFGHTLTYSRYWNCLEEIAICNKELVLLGVYHWLPPFFPFPTQPPFRRWTFPFSVMAVALGAGGIIFYIGMYHAL